jgi:DNA-binding GntR family transcriptional regulator
VRESGSDLGNGSPGLGGPVDEAPRLRQQVYDRMRRAILSGQFGPGERLSPTRIAQDLRVSTMPVREAIRLLEDEGLVETSARRWTRVATVTAAEAEEAYALVGLLEEFAVAEGTRKITPAYLTRLRQANQALCAAEQDGDATACINADEQFHSVLLEGCSNRTLIDTVEHLKNRMRLCESTFFRHASGPHRSAAQHAQIIAALEQRDRRLAGSLVRANWTSGLNALREVWRGQTAPRLEACTAVTES